MIIQRVRNLIVYLGHVFDHCDPYLVLVATKGLEELGLFGDGEAGY